MDKYLLRSLMFVPGHNERLLESASRSEADVLLLDLEDSVQPYTNKQKARDLIKQYIVDNKFRNYHVFPRINDRESGELLKDLYQLTVKGVDGFMYPKSLDGGDIFFIDKLLETIEYEKGFPIGHFKLIPLIETSAAIMNVQEISKSSKRTIAIAFGCEDFISDLGGVHDKDGKSIFTPRAIIAMAAKEAGITPVDTVHINIHDLDDLEKNLDLAKKLGFEGMLVLHPKEIPLVHQYFSPSEEEINNSKEMLRLAEEAKNENKGVALMNGKFIGPPMVLTAKKLLKKYELVNEKSKNRL